MYELLPFFKKVNLKIQDVCRFFCNLFIFICARKQKSRPDYFTYTCKISKHYINKHQSYGTLKNDTVVALCQFS